MLRHSQLGWEVGPHAPTGAEGANGREWLAAHVRHKRAAGPLYRVAGEMETPMQASQAAQDLFEQHGAAVYRFATVLLHHQQDAEDVVQETFLKLLHHLTPAGVRPTCADGSSPLPPTRRATVSDAAPDGSRGHRSTTRAWRRRSFLTKTAGGGPRARRCTVFRIATASCWRCARRS